MIDIKLLERGYTEDQAGENKDNDYRRYLAVVANRQMDSAQVDQLLELNRERKRAIGDMEQARARQNKVGQQIAQKKRAKEDASQELAEMQELSAELKSLQAKSAEAEEKVQHLLDRLPNFCHSSVPVGASEEENQEIKKWGEPAKFSFEPKSHDEIGEKLQGIDFERAGKVSGARFAFLRGEVARLERALINFMLDVQTGEHGYQEILPPYAVNSQTMYGTGQFPKFKEDVFHLEGTDYHLIPTAEAPVTNFFAGEILKESELPQRFAAFSPCFRSEAGSYGQDTKGLIRQHQFHKVEMLTFSHPDNSYEWHDKMTANAESILERLELPYRTVTLCTGDISFGAAKCHDLEVWLPAQKAYREISSVSNFEDFQARRADIRFRPEGGGKPRFLHTLNGSGLAVGRTLVAILENYQNEDGSVRVPEVLRPYMGGRELLKP